MNYDKLRKLAQAATPGPWEAYTPSPLLDTTVNAVEGSDGYDIAGHAMPRDAEFIAAANPTVVLALLDELRDAKAKLADAWEAGKVAGASVNEGWEDTLTNPYQDKS